MSIRPLSDALQKKAITELNEVPSRIPEDLQHIRNWLAKQPHLNARTDDQWLLSFLRGCKFSLERTKEKLDLYYTLRTLVPEFLSNKDPFQPEIQETIQLGGFLPLANTSDPAGPRVIIITVARLNPDRLPARVVLKAFSMCADIHVAEDDNYIIGGQHLVLDFRDLTYKQAAQFTPNLLKQLIICFQNAYPTRPKGIHFLNVPSIFGTFYNIIKSVVTEKLRNRIWFYTDKNFHTIHKIIPSAILPKEYGGEGDSIDAIAAALKQKVESYQDWFREDAAYYSDETKRPGKPRTSEEMFGVEGSFRKLNID